MLRHAGRVFRPRLASRAVVLTGNPRRYSASSSSDGKPKHGELSHQELEAVIEQDVFQSLRPKKRRDALDIVLEQIESDDADHALNRFSVDQLNMFEDLLMKLAQNRNDHYLIYVLCDLMKSKGFEVEVPVPRPPTPTVPYKPPVVDTSKKTKEELAFEEENLAYAKKAPPFPDLSTFDPLLDSREELIFPPTPDNPYENKVVVRNHESIFHETLARDGVDLNGTPAWKPTTTDMAEDDIQVQDMVGMNPKYPIMNMIKVKLVVRGTKKQTEKGKIPRMEIFTLMGDGNGLVGLGMGKHDDASMASTLAERKALKNLDYVERFENRTIWTEMETKFGATRIIMRPRPLGFGLRCAPILHQVLKAAGIKDISAKIHGSRNPIVVAQAALRMLQGGHQPLGMGDGVGGKGRKLNKGVGMRTASVLERERGRKLVNLRL